ncbi:MAG: CDP-alcohol phosphatidyltransferase family protein [Planctomycetes bacterium]|nr:CDP-alcohol phosphatidyltransferase family protein [Planctomycetota bacterium]
MPGLVVPPWLPNAITVLRIALIPAWWYHASRCAAEFAATGDGELHRALAFGALVGIGLSDVVDGFLARRFGLATHLGAVLDAVADKLAQVMLLVFLTFDASGAFTRVPLPFFWLVVGRDVLLGAGSLLVRRRRGRVEAPHRWHGKLSSLLFFFLLLALTAGLKGAATAAAFLSLGALIAASTLLYVREGWRQWSATPA